MIKLLLIAIHSSWFKMFCFIETEIITLKDPIFLEVWTVGQWSDATALWQHSRY